MPKWGPSAQNFTRATQPDQKNPQIRAISPAACPYTGQRLPECYPKFPRYPVWLAKMLSNPVIHMIKGARPKQT
ncbi:hypothetical protein DMR_30300 [Solidesulfovibrio magneticus RS-1]|uniref:Uncharacterized protein n=1 Tax=Solidesulfovibrio magneticus (strain ATCC 700980 / DSM 13731 / RS-1) TaxID=573370 RepID=C4XIE6_SOLM1|nr:hypothetical protein DMR_30300 [Solidesulfovibrio magneticus RS-1]